MKTIARNEKLAECVETLCERIDQLDGFLDEVSRVIRLFADLDGFPYSDDESLNVRHQLWELHTRISYFQGQLATCIGRMRYTGLPEFTNGDGGEARLSKETYYLYRRISDDLMDFYSEMSSNPVAGFRNTYEDEVEDWLLNGEGAGERRSGVLVLNENLDGAEVTVFKLLDSLRETCRLTNNHADKAFRDL